MPYYDVVHLVTVTDEYDKTKCLMVMFGTTAVIIRHQVSCRAAQRSQELQNYSIL
jgi:hypothetical protein